MEEAKRGALQEHIRFGQQLGGRVEFIERDSRVGAALDGDADVDQPVVDDFEVGVERAARGDGAVPRALLQRGQRARVQLVRQAALPERPQAAALIEEKSVARGKDLRGTRAGADGAHPFHHVRVRDVLQGQGEGVGNPRAVRIAG